MVSPPLRHDITTASLSGSRSAPSIIRHARSSCRAAVCGTAIGPPPASALVAEQAYAEPLALGGALSVPGSGAVLGSWRHRSRDQVQRL